MDQQDVVSTLDRLRHMDEDAVRMFDDAIGKTDDAEVKRQLQAIREDHRRHVADLDGVIREVSPLGTLETATTGEHGKPYEEAGGGSGAYGGEQTTTGNAGAYGGMGGDVGPGGGGSRSGGAVERGSRDVTGGDATADYGMGSEPAGRHPVPPGTRGSGDADMSTTRSTPRGGLNAGVRKRRESKGSEMAGGGTGAEEGHPNMRGQVEGDSGSSGSGVAGSGSGD